MGFTVRHIPDWFPFASFKRKAKEWRKSAEYVRDLPFDYVRAQMVSLPFWVMPISYILCKGS